MWTESWKESIQGINYQKTNWNINDVNEAGVPTYSIQSQ